MATSKYPEVGAAAPAFDLESSTGGSVSLADYSGKPLVVYFYPKADTPGCTTETCGFRDALAGYREAGCDVVGISPDPVEDVTKFAEKFDVNFPLLADADHAVCDAYGVWQEKNRFGKKYWGVARTTFVVDPTQNIAHVFKSVKPEGHDRQVLDWLKEAELA